MPRGTRSHCRYRRLPAATVITIIYYQYNTAVVGGFRYDYFFFFFFSLVCLALIHSILRTWLRTCGGVAEIKKRNSLSKADDDFRARCRACGRGGENTSAAVGKARTWYCSGFRFCERVRRYRYHNNIMISYYHRCPRIIRWSSGVSWKNARSRRDERANDFLLWVGVGRSSNFSTSIIL